MITVFLVLLSWLSVTTAFSFEQFNAASLQNYEQSLTRKLDKYLTETPYFLCNGYGTYFVYTAKGINASIPFAPDLFTRLKQVSHPLLASFSLTDVSLQTGSPLSEEVRANITDYLTLMQALPGNIRADPLMNTNASFVQAALTVTNMTTAYLNAVLAKGVSTQALVNQYLSSEETMSAFGILAYASAKAQLDDLNAFVQKYMPIVPPEQWNRVRTVVALSHMPRYSELHVQYFARLFNCSQTDGSRIIYAEGLMGWDAPLTLLSKHLLDFDIGRGLFNDSTRLHHDLLAPLAEEIVPKLLPDDLAGAHRRGECPMMKKLRRK